MKTTIKKVKVNDPTSKFHGKIVDILVENGKISKIGKSIPAKGKVIEGKNLNVSPGWIDMMVNFCDPGLEHKETVDSGIACAKEGGFTTVCTSPETEPFIATKSDVQYLVNRGKVSGLNILPYGALSENGKGENISEMFDMKKAGAIAFTDGKKEVSAGLMNRALLYTNNFDGVVLSFPYNHSMGNGQVNEGMASTTTGLKPIPALSEELQVMRDISLAEYNNSRLHFSMISTAGSVKLIKAAKKKGLKVTCGVAVMNLIATESDVETFDSNFKVLPPLRSESDRKVLWKGLEDGTVDVIVSDHTPQDIESKKLEFDRADFGVIGLETLYPLLNMDKRFSNDMLYQKLVSGPRRVLGLPDESIKEGESIALTVYDSNLEWKYAKTASLSQNSPFLGQEFTGKAVAIVQ